ncbi:MAG TPA: sugar nucleotide-binding protein [Stellaceae bacterium]|jgi:dTDP-4-dehydrorhamnose reductase|nr:sugar nucleotide-binding protein [Stellaceae bacterium]
MTPSTILLIGGDSEIGAATFSYMTALGRAARATTRRVATASAQGRIFFDLAVPAQDWRLPGDIDAACILAAIARLKACHDDPHGSARINVDQTLTLIERLLAQGIYVLFLSTNQVFDGTRACVPADAPPSPISEYGRQKAQVEAALIAAIANGRPGAILRFGKVVSPGIELLLNWRDRLVAGRRIQAFFDMVMAPIPVACAAQAIDALLAAQRPGVWQLTGPRDISYSAAALHIAQRVAADPGLVESVRASAAGIPIGGGVANTTLDSRRLREEFDIVVPDALTVIDALIGVAG